MPESAAVTRSDRMPSSLIWAFQASVRGSRSVSSRPWPTKRWPYHVVSPCGDKMKKRGTQATASSNVEPRSTSSLAAFALAVRWLSSHTQNSRYSMRERSMPVAENVSVIERQRGAFWAGRTQLAAPSSGLDEPAVPWRLLARPSAVSGLSISHSTGSAFCDWPTSLMVGSISCDRNWIGTRPRPGTLLYGKLCQVSAAALAMSNSPTIPAPRDVDGRLPQCHWFSASDTKRPPSDSNSSTYACPNALGLGFETAISPAMFRNDGASVWTPGIASITRVMPSGCRCSSVDRPPMKLEEGSKPSGGRVNVLCCFWNRPVRFTCPSDPRSYLAARP